MASEPKDGYERSGERFHDAVFTLRMDGDGEYLIIHHGDAYGETLSHVALDTLRAILALRKLHIVTDADKRVLDAMRDADIDAWPDDVPRMTKASEIRVARAELARRASRPAQEQNDGE